MILDFVKNGSGDGIAVADLFGVQVKEKPYSRRNRRRGTGRLRDSPDLSYNIRVKIHHPSSCYKPEEAKIWDRAMKENRVLCYPI